MAANTPNQLQSRLTTIALAVKPEGLIADQVCPRVPVEAENFTYTVYAEEMFFSIPETRMGRKSEANEVEFGGTLLNACTYDEGLDDFVPQKDIDNATSQNSNADPMGMATEGTTILVDMAREKRVATLFQTPANFAGSLKTTLSGTSQWSHPDSDPIAEIKYAMKNMLVKPNIMTISVGIEIALSMHPKVVAAVYGKDGVGASGSAAGVVSMAAIASLLGLKAILVGEAFFNAAKPGQPADMGRLWGDHATLARIDTSVRSVRGGAMPTFAVTAEWQKRRVRTIPDSKRGIDGGITVRVAEQLNELILWQKAGFLFQNAVAP